MTNESGWRLIAITEVSNIICWIAEHDWIPIVSVMRGTTHASAWLQLGFGRRPMLALYIMANVPASWNTKVALAYNTRLHRTAPYMRAVHRTAENAGCIWCVLIQFRHVIQVKRAKLREAPVMFMTCKRCGSTISPVRPCSSPDILCGTLNRIPFS